MKKKICCVLALVFWVLAACTLFSIKIEEQMTTQVAVLSENDIHKASKGARVPASILFYDEIGREHVFQVESGSIWSGRFQAQELDSAMYRVDPNNPNHLIVDNWIMVRFIQYSSRPLQSGESVSLESISSRADDLYLIVYPDGVPALGQLRRDLSVEVRAQDVLLLSVKDAPQPFMEGRAKSIMTAVEDLSDYGGEVRLDGAKKSIYSLLSVEQFGRNFPILSILLVMMLTAVTLWICSCFLIRDAKKNKVLLLINAAAAVLTLAGLPLVLGAIDLPSALLPKSTILDWGHYADEFRRIYAALECLPTRPQAVQDMAESVARMGRLAVGILAAGGIAVVVMVLAEVFAARKKAPQ